jgi:hypothetical protein
MPNSFVRRRRTSLIEIFPPSLLLSSPLSVAAIIIMRIHGISAVAAAAAAAAAAGNASKHERGPKAATEGHNCCYHNRHAKK